MVGAAVSDVGDERQVRTGQGTDQRRAHVAVVGVALRLLTDGVVGGGDGCQHHVAELVGGHVAAQVVLYLLLKAGHGNGAGHPSAVGAAHTVAHHGDGAAAGFKGGVGILVLAADEARVGDTP